MINAFQDINPKHALWEFRRILKPGGMFRANVTDRAVREETAADDDLFNKESGYFYLTRNPGAEDQNEVKPLGRITTKAGEDVPYYRMMRSYYRWELKLSFAESQCLKRSDRSLTYGSGYTNTPFSSRS